MATEMAKQIIAKGKKRVVVTPLLIIQTKEETRLGVKCVDIFEEVFVNEGLDVITRDQLRTLLNEYDNKNILDSITLPKLKNMASIDVVVAGNILTQTDEVTFSSKAQDISRGVLLSVVSGSVPRTKKLEEIIDAPVHESIKLGGFRFSLQKAYKENDSLTVVQLKAENLNNYEKRTLIVYGFHSGFKSRIKANNGQSYLLAEIKNGYNRIKAGKEGVGFEYQPNDYEAITLTFTMRDSIEKIEELYLYISGDENGYVTFQNIKVEGK